MTDNKTVFSCPGSSITDLGQSVGQSLTAALEFLHKDKKTEDKKTKKDKKTKGKKTKR